MGMLLNVIKNVFANAASGGKEEPQISAAASTNDSTQDVSDLHPGNESILSGYRIETDPDIVSPTSRKLHVGGKEVKPGWKLLNIQPADGVDYVGDISDLSQFSDGMFDVIYGSHVLEHISQGKMVQTLSGLYRILSPNGKLMISVPDLETLSKMFVDPSLNKAAKFHVMRMMFGGQTDPYDFHYIGLSFDILADYLFAANFKAVKRVDNFKLFNDTSSFAPYAGVPISLNVVAFKSPVHSGSEKRSGE